MKSASTHQRPRTEPCADCQGQGRIYSHHTRRPFHWGPQPTVEVWSPHDCFFCGGTGRIVKSVWGFPVLDHTVPPGEVRFR